MSKFKGAGLALAFALALLALPGAARAQGCGPQNPNCIVPTAPVGTSNNQAASTAFVQNQLASGIPYADISGLPAMSILGSIAGGNAAALTPTEVTTFCNTFTTSLSGCVPAPVSVTGRYLGDDAAWHALPAAATQTIVQGTNISLSGTCSGTALNCTVNSSGGAQLTLASRAYAITQDLSGLTAVQTLGYADGGDGGGATFQNIGSAPFQDANITAGTIVGGSGYVDGTYLFVIFTGGSGTGFIAKVVVSGGAVTAVTPDFNAGGYGYAVGDVLTASNSFLGGTGSGFTYTVTTLTTPSASFTDAAGNHWQYIVTSFLDPRQFGAKWDWIASDAGATDDRAAIQAALNYAAKTDTFAVNGNPTGSIVQMPRGSAKICSGLTLYGGTTLRGHGPQGTSLRVCDAWANGAENILTLCDTVPHVACFGVQIADFNITATTAAAANVGTYAIYTNAAQQARAIQNVSVYPGNRGCLRYDTGYGGAAGFYVYDFFCTMFPTAVSNGIVINAGTTLFKFFNTILEAGGLGYASNGFNLIGGQITIDGLHSEGITTMVNVDMATSTHSATVMHATGGNLCSEVIKLQGTNSPGNFAIYDGVMNGCSNLVTNGQAGGSSRSTDARPKDGWVFFFP